MFDAGCIYNVINTYMVCVLNIILIRLPDFTLRANQLLLLEAKHVNVPRLADIY